MLDETTRLQQIDTDQDGIHDYEELNFYQTSPYLPDTDSDGISDKDEIDQGSDPLCPEGGQCAEAEANVDTGPELIESPLVQETATPAELISGSIVTVGATASGTGALDIQALLSSPDRSARPASFDR